jgi:hypothetical protein
MQWRHLNVFNKECVIVCALPRGRRGDDSKVYRINPARGKKPRSSLPILGEYATTESSEEPKKY